MKNWGMKKIISLLIATALCVSMGDFSNATASPRIISETDYSNYYDYYSADYDNSDYDNGDDYDNNDYEDYSNDDDINNQDNYNTYTDEYGIKYQYDLAKDAYYVSEYTGNATDIVITSDINGKLVYKIASYAFCDNNKITGVLIPESVVEIADAAFENCTSLKRIDIPASVNKIGEYTFGDCANLYQVVFTDSLVEIDDSAFYGCKADLLTLVAPANSKAYVYAEQKQIKVATSTKKTIERKRNNGFAGETLSIKTYNNSVIPTFKSSNKSVLTVDKSGNVVLKKAGSASVTVSFDGISKTYKYKVVKRTEKNVLDIIFKYYVTKDMTDYEKVVEANKWLAANVDYDYAGYMKGYVPKVDHTAKGTLENGLAVCDGYSNAFKKIMDYYGIDTKIVIGFGNGGGHGWNLVKINSKWYHVDTTWNDPIWADTGHTGKVAFTDYLFLTDSEISRDHSWNNKDYPKANSKSIDKNYTHTGIYGAKLNRRTATIKNGKTVSFKVTGTKKKVTFTSDDKSIATVNLKGLVKGIKEGKTSIRIKIGDKSYVCEVTVK